MYMNSVEGDNHDDLISFDDNDDNNLPSKHNVISSLAVGGRWITSQCDLQVQGCNFTPFVILINVPRTFIILNSV